MSVQITTRADGVLLERIDADVRRLRRSRASLMLEILEKHYGLDPSEEEIEPLPKPATKNKQNGAKR
jgi:hypothetical protein